MSVLERLDGFLERRQEREAGEKIRRLAREDKARKAWYWAVGTAMLLGILGIVFLAFSRFEIYACALLIALAACLVGAFAGFLFGIPKTVTSDATAAGGNEYTGNTNLEQISDWLTKILVGAGLVEFSNIYKALNTFGSGFKNSKALGAFGWVAAPALVIVYSICGFLLAYLWARIYLISDLENRADAARERKSDVANSSAEQALRNAGAPVNSPVVAAAALAAAAAPGDASLPVAAAALAAEGPAAVNPGDAADKRP